MMHQFAIWEIVVWLTLLDIVNGQAATITTSWPSQCYKSMLPTTFQSTISVQAQAEAVASPCPLFGGSLVISPDTATDLVFTGLEAINGDIFMDILPASITVSFPNLHTAGRVVWMMRSRNHIAFDRLTSVRELIIDNWIFPFTNDMSSSMLQRLGEGLVTVKRNVFLRNTTLTTVNLPATSPPLENGAILGNANLRSIKLNGTMSGEFTMTNNSHSTQGETLSVDIAGLTIGGGVKIENNRNISLSDVAGIGGDLLIRNNTGLQTVALDNLPALKGSLQVSDNPDLTRLSMRKLVSVQKDLQITDNNRLLSAGDLLSLSVVGGSVSLEGPFDSIIWASVLKSVAGSFTVDSSRNFHCDSLETLLTKGFIGDSAVRSGALSCRSTNETTRSDNSSTTTISTTASSSSFSIGTVIGITIAAVVACIIIVLAIFCCWRRRRQRKTTLEAKRPESDSQSPESEPFSVFDQRSILEIWSDPASELATKLHHSELPTKEQPAELSIKQDHAKISVKHQRSRAHKKGRVLVHETPHELPG